MPVTASSVVNCFQIVFLSGSLTTSKSRKIMWKMLWIAFKLYFYQVHWQRVLNYIAFVTGCELLSNCIFIRFIDNTLPVPKSVTLVVNCFQIVFLSGSLTTLSRKLKQYLQLWIAFKLYFYQVHWQPCFRKSCHRPRCELLSNCIFIRFIDNSARGVRYYTTVVNCFQIVFLSGSLTTFWE